MVTQASGDAISLSPASKLMAKWAGYFSPSQLNPFDLNPLRDLLARQIDFERLRADSPFKLFVGATHANTGKLRVFRERELTVEMLLASACLPKIHHAVEIDGEPYWDGGYSANPAVFPLFYDCDARDVLLVLLSPLRTRRHAAHGRRDRGAHRSSSASAPTSCARCGCSRSRPTFASPSFLTLGRLERRLRQMRFHMIDSSGVPDLQRTETQVLAHGPFLERLREPGASVRRPGSMRTPATSAGADRSICSAGSPSVGARRRVGFCGGDMSWRRRPCEDRNDRQ